MWTKKTTQREAQQQCEGANTWVGTCNSNLKRNINKVMSQI
jgi:hypothetical protein